MAACGGICRGKGPQPENDLTPAKGKPPARLAQHGKDKPVHDKAELEKEQKAAEERRKAAQSKKVEAAKAELDEVKKAQERRGSGSKPTEAAKQ